ncbi:hypothetical protein [Asticcacaulis sp. AC402]|uniref:hypothetical protein n=1 Tax=Asticcacaulis sp. AC402 TaxID=1282361 RepID=UPI0003C3CF03|nr:hypothetical protein [Asticcacaulis sp. AC402]ESQ73716.1 hypothetical protein ABAC402_17780 [Asticcacaulis sp. AC402]
MMAQATTAERRQALPGDKLVSDPVGAVMHAVTIRVAPEIVWPWLVQMGAGRAGWYSYDWIDNDATPSATTLVPALQHLTVGDIMPSLPGATASFRVAAIAPFRDLVLTVPSATGSILASWEFCLEPTGDGQTRLMVRGHVGSLWPGGRETQLPQSPREHLKVPRGSFPVKTERVAAAPP